MAQLVRNTWYKYLICITRDSRDSENLKFGGNSRRVKQTGVCSSNDMIMTLWAEAEILTTEDKIIVALYIYRNRNKKDFAWKKVSEEVRQSVKL